MLGFTGVLLWGRVGHRNLDHPDLAPIPRSGGGVAGTVAAADRLLFSTGFPYQYRTGQDARQFLDGCGLDDCARAGFAQGNWLRLTGALAA